MSEGEGGDLFALVVEECMVPITSASARRPSKVVKALSISRSVLALRTCSSSPMVLAAVRRSFDSCGARGLVGLSNTAMVAILGTGT